MKNDTKCPLHYVHLCGKIETIRMKSEITFWIVVLFMPLRNDS